MTLTTSDRRVEANDGAAPTEGVDSIVDRFRARVADRPERTALRHREGDQWCDLSWGDYGVAVNGAAAGLINLGIERGDRVALLSANRPEWHIADLGILATGAVTVPIYPTNSSSQVAYVLADSGARVCFVDGAEQLAKVLLRLDELPRLERVVMFTDVQGVDRRDRVLTLDELRSSGGSHVAVDLRVAGIDGDDLATLVYTSGTTGAPKGACITHANISWTIDAMHSMVALDPSDRWLSYLPLSHIAERVTSHFGQIAAGGQTWFARDLASLPDDLRACRPTIFFAVPRVWQKFHGRILDSLHDKRIGLDSIVDRAAEASAGQHDGAPERNRSRLSTLTTRAAQVVVERALAPSIRRRLGLDRARLLVSSAAPIHPDLLRWFEGIGLAICEVWGQTEDCGPATMNPPDAIRIGSIGTPIPGLEVRTLDDGELLVKGGSVCSGYFGRPDETEELIDEAGWMHTGDLGRIDGDGYVWITGRKKDLIINAAGKNIAPSEIEARFSMEPLVGQAVVVGDGRRYLNALLWLDEDAVVEWAKEHRISATPRELIDDARLLDAVADSVRRVNREHAPVEQIKYWRVLPESLTIEGGALTPTLKVKRNVVQERFAELIESMYPDER